jgi:hypothetical protein
LATYSDDRKNIIVANLPHREGSQKDECHCCGNVNFEINGIWLFAGEGAFRKRKPLPQNEEFKNYRDYIHNKFFYTYVVLQLKQLQISPLTRNVRLSKVAIYEKIDGRIFRITVPGRIAFAVYLSVSAAF